MRVVDTDKKVVKIDLDGRIVQFSIDLVKQYNTAEESKHIVRENDNVADVDLQRELNSTSYRPNMEHDY